MEIPEIHDNLEKFERDFKRQRKLYLRVKEIREEEKRKEIQMKHVVAMMREPIVISDDDEDVAVPMEFQDDDDVSEYEYDGQDVIVLPGEWPDANGNGLDAEMEFQDDYDSHMADYDWSAMIADARA